MKNVSSKASYRKGGAKALGIKTPMKAIREKCRDCCCDQVKEIALCKIKTCALWHYRMGKYPKS